MKFSPIRKWISVTVWQEKVLKFQKFLKSVHKEPIKQKMNILFRWMLPTNWGNGFYRWNKNTKSLSRTNPQTFGVPDSEYKFEVDVPPDVESFSNINTDTNPFKVSVKMKAAEIFCQILMHEKAFTQKQWQMMQL